MHIFLQLCIANLQHVKRTSDER